MSSFSSTAEGAGGGNPAPRAVHPSRDVHASAGRAEEGRWIRVHRAAMACRFEILLDDGDAAHVSAAREALDEADRLEAALSVFRDTSELSRVNRTAAGEARGGRCRPVRAPRPLPRAARAHAGDVRHHQHAAQPLLGIPQARGAPAASPEAIAAARALVGMSGVVLDEAARTVRFRQAGVELNLGSIGKGYALDRMAGLLRARGVSHALLSAGGSSAVAVGGRGAGWTIDIRPRQVGERSPRPSPPAGRRPGHERRRRAVLRGGRTPLRARHRPAHRLAGGGRAQRHAW